MSTPTDLEHRTWTVRHLTETGYFRAECSCGWSSDWFEDQAPAEDAAVDHVQVETYSLNAVLNQLLDLQEDLSQLVAWLAGNWTDDLPVPYLHGRRPGRSDRAPLVEVVVRCPTAAVLDRVADLVGTQPRYRIGAIFAVADIGMTQLQAMCLTSEQDL